jgi:hypothetical protein
MVVLLKPTAWDAKICIVVELPGIKSLPNLASTSQIPAVVKVTVAS